MTNRKNTFISIFIVALTFAFGACSKDDENEAINNNEKTVYSNIHEYVDLGLPSGTLWATCNVGASKPEEFGEYFAWGETKPKDKYDWSTYKWCDGSYNTLTKYGFDNGYDKYGIVDNKERLDPEDDAATANWGVDWCMPSKEQFKELYNSSYTTTEWKAVNGVNGYMITSKKNNNTMFLPAAGWCNGTSLEEVRSLGQYWSSSIGVNGSEGACRLTIYSVRFDSNADYRCYGHSVRPVRVKK